MNTIYSLVWNSAKQAWVVASELANPKGAIPLKAKISLVGQVVALSLAVSHPALAVVTTVTAGQTSTGVVVNNGDILNVMNGGTAESSKINGSGVINLNQVSQATGTVITGTSSAVTNMVVVDGSSATNTVANSSKIVSRGTTNATTLNNSILTVNGAVGAANNTTVNKGSSLQVGPAAKASGQRCCWSSE
ncbi:hypothetical protein ASE99_24310 [Serratia sp. Leaf51]|nr:hypothetical protein ASE99_24310 [Serratia sp. Leaf51]